MKLKVIFFCMLYAQTSASFFDEFRGAMSSVENSFGRLLTDVVTDVQETIGCTILAVKQVLALGGIYHESSDYDTRCRGLNNGKDISTFVQVKNQEHRFRSESDEKSLSERVSEEIHESISNVQSTMFDLIDKNGSYKNIVKAKANIKRESDRLSEISALLRRELNNISEEVKRELRKVESNSNHQTIDSIWSEIKILHEIELKHRNTPEAIQIRHILNEIVSVLRQNEIRNVIPLQYTETAAENGSSDAYLEIETQLKKMKQEQQEKDNFDDADADTGTESNPSVQKPDDFPVIFNDAAKKILDETSRTFRVADGSSQKYENVAPITTEHSISTVKYVHDPEGSPDYKQLFQLAPEGSPARKEALEEAKKLIERSKETDAVMNDYFKNTDKVGTNVFDVPDLLKFA